MKRLFSGLDDFERAGALIDDLHAGWAARRTLFCVRFREGIGSDPSVALHREMAFRPVFMLRPRRAGGLDPVRLRRRGRCIRHVDYWDFFELFDQAVPGFCFVSFLFRKLLGQGATHRRDVSQSGTHLISIFPKFPFPSQSRRTPARSLARRPRRAIAHFPISL